MASPSVPTTLRQRIETTTHAFLSALEEGGAQNDASLINRDVTADCPRYMIPASLLQAFGLPVDYAFTPAEFQETYAKDIKVLTFKNNVIANLVIDTKARRAAFTSVAEVHPRSGKEAWSYEQAWFMYFTEDGTKVEKVVEFCDKDGLVKMAGESA